MSSLLFHSNKENLLYFDKTSTYLVFLPNNKSIFFEKIKERLSINKILPGKFVKEMPNIFISDNAELEFKGFWKCH